MRHAKRHSGKHGGTRGFGRTRIDDDTETGGRGLYGGRGGRHGHRGDRMHGRGGRGRKRFTGEELRLLVLGLLEGEVQHGYQLIRNFAERSGEQYSPSPGVLYPMLTMLQDMELIEELDDAGGKRRNFQLTEAGQTELDGQRADLAGLLEQLAAMAETASRTDAAPVKRAMQNLRTAAKQRLSREDTQDDDVFQVAAILDEAAQKIERL